MQEQDTRNELEVANESMVMTYLNMLKYAEYHCNDSQDPMTIADHVFMCWYKAVSELNDEHNINE